MYPNSRNGSQQCGPFLFWSHGASRSSDNGATHPSPAARQWFATVRNRLYEAPARLRRRGAPPGQRGGGSAVPRTFAIPWAPRRPLWCCSETTRGPTTQAPGIRSRPSAWSNGPTSSCWLALPCPFLHRAKLLVAIPAKRPRGGAKGQSSGTTEQICRFFQTIVPQARCSKETSASRQGGKWSESKRSRPQRPVKPGTTYLPFKPFSTWV